MRMYFKGLEFELIDGRIVLTDCFKMAKCKDKDKKKYFNLVEVQLAGENHSSHCGAKQFESSETNHLKYISYSETHNRLEIVQASDKVSVVTTFLAYDDTRTLRVWSHITNSTDKPIVLEHISSFLCYGLGENGTESVDNLYLYKFYNSWHVECQPVRLSFRQLGLFNGNDNRSMKRIVGSNTGSWSTKEELPQSIIEDTESGQYMMFQIENNNSWYYEISDNAGLLYLNLGGPNTTANQWSKVIHPGCGFGTVTAAVVVGSSINEVVGEMTKYRRHIVRPCKDDKQLPVIFNEYMHLSWDNPDEERTRRVVPSVSELGAKYYVIDCGWHDECDYDVLYKKVGKWEASKRRYPSGIRSIVDFIKSHGMKAGLWMEPEIIGLECEEMENYYGDECFLYRNGKKIVTSNRKFLDFRKEKVRKYLDSVIAKLVEYGVNYIKFDYNQDCGAGTELDSDSLGDGLMENSIAYCRWVESVMDRYPNLIIEACASGGQRLDYKTLSIHPIVSTSDQTNYKKYPYIAANILSAVLPEQAAVWSYPVESQGMDSFDADTFESVNARIDKEQVIMNMVNAMLGRMHLASAVHLLSEEKRALIKEGIDYYNSIVSAKKSALPYFPWGFSDFLCKKVASGFISGKTIYLALWNLGGDGVMEIDLPGYNVKSAKIAYPEAADEKITRGAHSVRVELGAGYKARFAEIEICPQT